MTSQDYYEDKRFCPRCGKYVRYLRSWIKTYCTNCLGEATLFSHLDLMAFRKALEEPAKPGRRRRTAEGA